MESLQIFCDIPDIQVNEDGPLHSTRYYPDFDDGFVDQSMSFASQGRLIPGFGTDISLDTRNRQRMSTMQRFLDQPPFMPGCLRAEPGRPYELSGQFNFDQPYRPRSLWPIMDEYQRHPSPDDTIWSASSGGSSGLHLEDRSPPESFCCTQDGRLSCSSRKFPHYMEHLDRRSELFAGGDSCITLSDIQQVPDEDPVQSAEDSDRDIRFAYAAYDSDPHGYPVKVEAEVNQYSHDYQDSGVGESIRDAESVQPCGQDDEDSEDADYNPPATSPRPAKRACPSSPQSRNSSNGTHKRPSHGRKVSTSSSAHDNSRVTKRTKSNSTSPIRSGNGNSPRPFPCPIALYGCTSTFASKNEWKRHVSSQHIRLGFWRCDLCALVAPNQPPNEFNRKDLFTQHLRRMHMKPIAASQKSTSALELPVTEDNLGRHQERCYKMLREAPQQSSCLFCARRFEGPNSWDERMEHVGRHLEKEKKGESKQSALADWISDPTLEEWLREEGLIDRDGSGGWQLGDGVPRRQKGN